MFSFICRSYSKLREERREWISCILRTEISGVKKEIEVDGGGIGRKSKQRMNLTNLCYVHV